MDKLIRITLTPLEALLIGTMIDAMTEELEPQLEQLDQDQRTFLLTMQRVRKYLPVVKA